MANDSENGAPGTEGAGWTFRGYKPEEFDRKLAGAEACYAGPRLLEAGDPRLRDPAFRDGYFEEILRYASDNYGHELRMTLAEDLEEADDVAKALRALGLLGHPILVSHAGLRHLNALSALSRDLERHKEVPDEISSRLAGALGEVLEALELLLGFSRGEDGGGVTRYDLRHPDATGDEQPPGCESLLCALRRHHNQGLERRTRRGRMGSRAPVRGRAGPMRKVRVALAARFRGRAARRRATRIKVLLGLRPDGQPSKTVPDIGQRPGPPGPPRRGPRVRAGLGERYWRELSSSDHGSAPPAQGRREGPASVQPTAKKGKRS